MKAKDLLRQIEELGIEVIAGVPDSTLKQFCDGLQRYEGGLRHYVTANEGAAVGLAVGAYLSSGKPACIYLQNSGIGNMVNPVASLANEEVYGIPMLFVVGWRGEPGVKDEPQHVFQGKITCELFDTLRIAYRVLDKNTTAEEMQKIMSEAEGYLQREQQYAILVKKGAFEADEKFQWENGQQLNREEVLGRLAEYIPDSAAIVSTTGKISRELYEQSNRRRGNHAALFMTVGGMGHASMIAFGIAQNDTERRVFCVDGDGAVLMHMGGLPFLAANAGENFVHIVLNNQAHESVGAMPTGCQEADIAAIAAACGYRYTERISTQEQLAALKDKLLTKKGPCLFEIMVSLDSRADLSRPAETAKANRDSFMEFYRKNPVDKSDTHGYNESVRE